MTIDPITLEVLWNRLIAVVNEQAAALMRTSFTTVVRESGDLSAGVFDRRGNMIGQVGTIHGGEHCSWRGTRDKWGFTILYRS